MAKEAGSVEEKVAGCIVQPVKRIFDSGFDKSSASTAQHAHAMAAAESSSAAWSHPGGG